MQSTAVQIVTSKGLAKLIAAFDHYVAILNLVQPMNQNNTVYSFRILIIFTTKQLTKVNDKLDILFWK